MIELNSQDLDETLVCRVRRRLLAGVAVVVPLAVTFHVLWAVLAFFDNQFQPLIETALGLRLPGLGLLTTVLVLYGAGLLATNVLGLRMLELTDRLLGKVPGVGQIYRGTQRVVDSVSRNRQVTFQQVVFVEFPRPGMRALGFVTGRMQDAAGGTHCTIFVPTTPVPTSGYLVIVPEEEMENTTFSVEEGIEFVISAGVSSPRFLPLRTAAGEPDAQPEPVNEPESAKQPEPVNEPPAAPEPSTSTQDPRSRPASMPAPAPDSEPVVSVR